jgi:hypothetical protein
MLLPALPVRLSLKPLPIRCSMLISVSEAEPPVACAPCGRETDGDAGTGKGVGDGVVAASAVEDVVAVTGVEDVVERVAGAVARASEHQAQTFDVGGQGVGREVAVDDVVAAGGEAAVALADDIAGVVDTIGVGAVAAEHRVGANATVQKIRPGATVEHVVGGVAGDQTVVEAAADQVLDADQRVGAGTAGGLRPGGRQTEGDASRGKGVGDGVVAGPPSSTLLPSPA